MIAVYRIFQMILGVIISVMLLYFLLTYTGGYKQTQEDIQKAEILKSFADEARSVYLTGIPTNFTHFSRYDFSSCYVKTKEKDIPQIGCLDSDVPDVPIETPVIFHPGERVFVSADSLDYGWWVFGYAEAMPDTVFVFSPDNTDGAWEIMTNIVEHLPDTSDEWSVVKVRFAFCDGSDILYPCGGRPCDKSEFLSMLATGPSGSVSPCTANLKGKSLVTISGSCSSQKGVCIIPPNSIGVGNAFVEGSLGTYVYKDPLDLVALAVGGTEKDEFGKTGAEKLYHYKNTVLMERLSMAAKIMSRRLYLTANDVPQECGSDYIGLAQVLDGIQDSWDYNNLGDMYDLNEKLNEAKNIYQRLVDAGCERDRENYGA